MGEINTDLPIEKVIINDIEVPVAVPNGYANVGDTTATADTVMEGKEFYNAQGEKTVGTYKDMLQYRVDQTNSCAYLFHRYTGKSLDVKNLNTSNVTDMQYMFSECSTLTNLDLSSWDMSNVTNTNTMFYYCTALTNVILPSTIKTMGSSFFSNCSKLTEFTILATEPPTLANATSCISSATTSIYVPDASVDAYKGATNWSTYADLIKPLSSKGV